MSSEPDPKRYIGLAPRAPQGEVLLPDLISGHGPIELDIGFGRGRSLLERAQQEPESRIIGVEIKAKLAYQVSEKAKSRKLDNICVLCEDVR